jgi:hypothetical protein
VVPKDISVNYAAIAKLVTARGGRICGRQGPRGLKAFVHSIMKRLKLLKRKQSHTCPICTRAKQDEKELKRLQARLPAAHSQDERKELTEAIEKLESEWPASRGSPPVARLQQQGAG